MTPGKDTDKITNSARIGILSNPLGGRARRRAREIRELGERVAGPLYREATSGEEIARALATILEGEPELLCLIGGDGTIQAALTALNALRPKGNWPILMALPGGTTNMTGKDLGPWFSVEKGLEALDEGAFRGGGGADDPSGPGKGPFWPGRLHDRPVLKVEGSEAGTVCGMFFGAGAVAEGIRVFHDRFERDDLPGDSAFRSTIFHLLRILAFGGDDGSRLSQSIAFAVDDDPPGRRPVLLCMVSTLNRLILGFTPFWGEEPGAIRFTLVEKGARGLWWRLRRLGRGRPGRALTPKAGYTSRNAHRVTLAFDGFFVVDGEVFEARAEGNPLTLSTIPGVRWLVPG